MNSELRRRFVRDMMGDLSQVGDSRFEDLASYLDGEIFERPGLGRGLNAEGASVSGAVDSVTPSGTHVTESSSDKDYFKFPYKKLRHDLRHSLDEHPGASIALYSSRECGPQASTTLTRFVRRIKRIGIEAEWYDSRRIAELIVDNLLTNQVAIDRIKSFLPNLERISEQYAFLAICFRPGITYTGAEIRTRMPSSGA